MWVFADNLVLRIIGTLLNRPVAVPFTYVCRGFDRRVAGKRPLVDRNKSEYEP